ncbi:hypothetical protein QYE76_025997 [Lolium multiflorum]|uniref:Exocyst subunit Exo70 family protein n=1 Tax=Lolium multiflorum TaxID=4521 RepID=A0AAD8VX53_LOLMU|nr:hypothetical protein QYE76_025997 [Lolium multiflorum]
MAGRLAAVPELSTTGFTAPSSLTVSNIYRNSLRSVPVYGGHIRPTLFSLPGHSGSGDSSSYQSNNSGCSSGSVSAAAGADFSGAYELTEIAHRMISDGFTQRMVQEFETGAADRALESWFFELDVDWVLRIREEQLQDRSASSLREMVERWIRALTVVVLNIKELVHGTLAVTRFGKASISAMLVFVYAIVPALKAEKLQAVVSMYICISSASYQMVTTPVIDPEAQIILNEIGSSLSREVDGLSEAIASTMEEMTTLMEGHDSWDIEIRQGGGEVHMNTRLMMNCIVWISKARASTQNDTGDLDELIDDTMDSLKDLLLKKSELCSDLSLRYLFLLNNYNFIADTFEPSVSLDLELWSGRHWRPTPECEKYMYSYLQVSWGHVLSCIPKSSFPGPLHRWISTSSLAKFESAFLKTYQAQRFWKVPDPRLRAALRRVITQRVISGYRDYLREHPELEKHVGHESSNPTVLEGKLGELFEG